MSLRSTRTYTALTTLTASLIMVLATACAGSGSLPTPTAVPTHTPPPAASSGPGDSDLTETQTFTRLGFSMAYPAGWFTGLRDRTIFISELNEDHDDRGWGYRGGPRPTKGYQVSLTLDAVEYMKRYYGLRSEHLGFLKDVYDANYTLTTKGESTRTEILGLPALRVTGTLGWGRVVNCFLGFSGRTAFLFCLGAPTKQALDEFMPTWEQMLASIKLVGE